jgi:hypothetical protein
MQSKLLITSYLTTDEKIMLTSLRKEGAIAVDATADGIEAVFFIQVRNQ